MMPRLLQRRLHCFYCNGVVKNDRKVPQSWQCPHCEAVNHLDKYGRITDPPAQETTPSHKPPVLYARPVSPPPLMASSTQSPFCDTCQRNQAIVNKAMAEYIPDEDDPDYDQHVSTAEAYLHELETRYPPVCQNCIGQVQDRIRAAGYAARTDDLRRKLEDSKKKKLTCNTPRQIWTLRTLLLAKWIYIICASTEIIWHAWGILRPSYPALFGEMTFCLPQHEDSACLSPEGTSRLLQWSLLGDGLTLWWNPKLRQMVMRPGGRFHGLKLLWLLRLLTLALRTASVYWLPAFVNGDSEANLVFFAHGAMSVWLVLSLITSWRVVRIKSISPATLAQNLEPYLPNIHSSPTSPQEEYRPIRPKADVYDSMAQSFTSSFGGPSGDQPPLQLPPSPTLTATTASVDSENITPYAPRISKLSEEDMDWTPTRNRFGKQLVTLQPQLWTTQANEPQPKPKHSIFSQPDPNPFRHKVPAFPKNPAQKKLDPWKSFWAPAAEETKKTFLSEVMQKGSDPDQRKRLQAEAVPKAVKKDEELFQKPQLKYDYQGYVGEKSTGLEDSFNDLLAK